LTIQDYNNTLINNLDNINLTDYFKFIIKNIYKNLDLTFVDYFLELCEHEDKFYINHTKLQEYQVINDINTSKDIKRRLESLNLIENEDYQVGNIAPAVRIIKRSKIC
jgi:hypothetical protein